MRKLFAILVAVAMVSFVTAPAGISKKERKTASKFLKDSEENVLNQVSKLSEAQLKFKSAPDRWSVEECMMHIAASEKMLRGMVDQGMQAAANPEKRADIKMTDAQIMSMIEDRTNKVKTFPPLEPPNTGFKSASEAMASFRENRAKLIDYVKTTPDDLRNHVLTLPVGSFDAYQMTLFIGGHSNRHVNQMKEVMADPGFPKN
ncbi:MAG TPA: DinB family protein [Chitinophagaceae bacterium]|nr:DinB family protein [Chitinophagaceae bacterium]